MAIEERKRLLKSCSKPMEWEDRSTARERERLERKGSIKNDKSAFLPYSHSVLPYHFKVALI